MPTGALMGKRKNSDKDDSDKPAERLTDSIKLRPTFKKKLEMVADDEGLFPGDLVERELEQYVETNYVRVLRKRLKEAEGG